MGRSRRTRPAGHSARRSRQAVPEAPDLATDVVVHGLSVEGPILGHARMCCQILGSKAVQIADGMMLDYLDLDAFHLLGGEERGGGNGALLQRKQPVKATVIFGQRPHANSGKWFRDSLFYYIQFVVDGHGCGWVLSFWCYGRVPQCVRTNV